MQDEAPDGQPQEAAAEGDVRGPESHMVAMARD